MKYARLLAEPIQGGFPGVPVTPDTVLINANSFTIKTDEIDFSESVEVSLIGAGLFNKVVPVRAIVVVTGNADTTNAPILKIENFEISIPKTSEEDDVVLVNTPGDAIDNSNEIKLVVDTQAQGSGVVIVEFVAI